MAEGGEEELFDLAGLGLSSKENKIVRPVATTVNIKVNGEEIAVPATPVRSTNANGIVGYDIYETWLLKSRQQQPEYLMLTASTPDAKLPFLRLKQTGTAVVKFDYREL